MRTAISQSIIDEIKYRSDIQSVISSYVTLKRTGKNMVGLCPFHGEKTPSFTVYPENGSFYCFGCKAGGDVFTFIKLIENLDYIDAVKLLAERCGVTITEDGEDDALHKLQSTVYEINRETARFYYSNLSKPEGKWALDYYLSRGLTASTIKSFGLGVALPSWDSLIVHLKSKGFSLQDMVQADVAVKGKNGSYYDRFRDRSMFPVINVRGNVVAFSGRRRTEDKTVAKYVNTRDTVVYNKSKNLFALNFAKAHCAESIILVEGNFDTVALHQNGFKNAVAPLGTAFTSEQAMILSRYTEEVILCFDSDTAGEAAIEKAFNTLAKTGLSVKVIRLPSCKDPDEFLKKNKPSDFEKLIKSAVPETEYKLIKASKDIEPVSPEAKIKYLNNAVQILSTNPDAISVDFYVSKLADEYGVSKETLNMKISQIKKENSANRQKREIKQAVRSSPSSGDVNTQRRGNERAVVSEEMLISIIMNHPDMCDTACKLISADDFVTDINRRIFVAVCEKLKNNQSFSLSDLSDRFNSDEIGLISKILNTGFKGNNPEPVLKDCIDVLKSEKALKLNADSDNWAEQIQMIAKNKKGN